MGYGIVLISDDDALRAAGPDHRTVAHLRAAVGADSYPAAGLPATTQGPWHRAGAWHHSALTVLDVRGPTDVTVGTPAGDDDGDLVWTRQLTAGIESRATKEILRRPREAALARHALDTGADPYETILGPDRTRAGRSSWTAWWLYADRLHDTWPDLDGLAGAVHTAIDDRTLGPAHHVLDRIGLHKAGAAAGPGTVRLVWSGNRMCRPDELTEAETVRYQQLLLAS